MNFEQNKLADVDHRSNPLSHRSTLLMSRQMGRPSAAAALIARSVPTITPSTAEGSTEGEKNDKTRTSD